MVLAAMTFPGRLRTWTIVTLVFSTLLALSAIRFVPAFLNQEPTPWMGVFERTGQYITSLWYAVFAVMLIRLPAPAVNPSATGRDQAD